MRVSIKHVNEIMTEPTRWKKWMNQTSKKVN